MSLGFKRWIDEDGKLRGRLAIGYMRQGLNLAYYEPLGIDQEIPDRGPDIGIFHESRGYKTVRKDREPLKGSLESWSPSPGDVYWLPWAKPFNGESAGTRGLEIIQRRDLYDMWSYLMATDPAEVEERAQGLNVPGKMRRWAFYQIAAPWKRKDMKKRAAEARRTGRNIEDVELVDSEDEDEGYGISEEEMAERMLARKRKAGQMPPPGKKDRPSNKRRKKTRGNDDDNDPWPHIQGPYSRRSDSGIGFDGDRMRSPSVLNGRDFSVDSDAYDARPPQDHNSDPSSAPRRPPYAHPSVETVVDKGDEAARRQDHGHVSSDLRSFGGLFGTGNLPSTSKSTSKTPPSNRPHQSDKQFEAEMAYNLGLSDDEALQRTLRASEAPETQYGHVNAGLDDDEAIEAGIRASMEPDVGRNQQQSGLHSNEHAHQTSDRAEGGGVGGNTGPFEFDEGVDLGEASGRDEPLRRSIQPSESNRPESGRGGSIGGADTDGENRKSPSAEQDTGGANGEGDLNVTDGHIPTDGQGEGGKDGAGGVDGDEAGEEDTQPKGEEEEEE